jgi:hypothetical protein
MRDEKCAAPVAEPGFEFWLWIERQSACAGYVAGYGVQAADARFPGEVTMWRH